MGGQEIPGAKQGDAPILKKGLEQAQAQGASRELLGAAQNELQPGLKEVIDRIAQDESYKNAIKSEVDAESSWRRAFPKGENTATQDKLKEELKNPSMDPHTRGYLQYLSDNFSKIAGIASQKQDKNPALSIADAAAFGGMNETSPARIKSGVEFLQNKFFAVSGLDDKVTAERLDRLIYDHSFQLFPQDVQDHFYELSSVIKSADQRLSNFDQSNKRTKSGLSADDAKTLNPEELSDNLRIQALEKRMFGKSLAKLDGKAIGPEAKSQYAAASQRYKELKEKVSDLLQY